jgi:hypothetical protein
MIELERRLVELADHISYPVQPPIAARAATQLRAGVTPARSRLRVGLVAAAVVVVLGALTVAVSPAARHAVADWLGIDGVRISFDHPSPSPSVALGGDLALGRHTTLAAARRDADFHISVPAALGPPDEVFFGPYVAGGEVSLVYSPGAVLPESANTGVGALLTQFQGRIDRPSFRKFIEFGTGVEKVTVGGVDGFFINGAPHLLYYDRTGDPLEEAPRLAGTVLVWQRDGVTYRLEAEVSKSRAVEIATSLR